jgi:hypothetical protein
MQSPTVLDSTAPFDLFAKNGYYTVGNSIAVTHGVAVQEASRTGLPVVWHFNEQEYRAMDWRTSWNLPISEVYRLRAQQLRDKYKYLMLWFSGGADSAVILQTFIDNNIHLDEVVVAWANTTSEGRYTPNTVDKSASNFISEWDFAIKPRLEWLAKVSPRTKITVVDFLVDLPEIEDFEDTWTIIEKPSYYTIKRQRALDKIVTERFKHHGDGLASIAGISPPMISVVNQDYLAVFFMNNMASAGVGKSDVMSNRVPRNVEFFYWTPDMPEIVREQAHLLLSHLAHNPKDRALFHPFDLRTSEMRTITPPEMMMRREIIKKIIYPTWDPSIFQSDKPTDQLYSPEIHSWFYKMPASRQYIESWQSAMNSQYSMISKSSLRIDHNGVIRDFAKFLPTRFYPVGKIVGQ